MPTEQNGNYSRSTPGYPLIQNAAGITIAVGSWRWSAPGAGHHIAKRSV